MDTELYNLLDSDNGFYVHVGVIIALLLGGFGLPIPEDVPLLLAGIAASKKIVSFQAIFVTSYVGVVVADQLVYLIGYVFGPGLIQFGKDSKFFPAITEDKVEEIHQGLRNKRLLYIFLGRHLFPLRSVTFVTAGALRIPFLEFLVSDMLAAFVSVLIMLVLGFVLGEAMTPEVIEQVTKQVHLYIIGIVAIIAFFMLLRRIQRKRRAALKEQKSPA